jgi:predicted HicB family RNase H-like nuclease
MRKAKKRRGRPPVENGKERINLRVSHGRKARYERAAAKLKLGLSAWIKQTLDEAS